jgi:hypothetical protein
MEQSFGARVCGGVLFIFLKCTAIRLDMFVSKDLNIYHHTLNRFWNMMH